MLYELSTHDVIALQAACAVAQARMAENAESSERCANSQHLPKAERVSAARLAKWYQERTATFKSIRKALDEGRGITSLERAKEALER